MRKKRNVLIYALLMGLSFMLSSSCVIKDINRQVRDIPVLSTTDVIQITQKTAVVGGEIIDDGGSRITTRGICWSIDKTPTLRDNKRSSGNGTGSFTATIARLEPGTKYYVRTYATNRNGTAYGNVKSFTTASSKVVDIDGNEYGIVTIGSQTWMAENLKTTHYRNGDEINDGTGAGTVSGEEAPKYWFVYDDDLDNVSPYGMLYTWYTVNDGRSICPEGWHVASNEDWAILRGYLRGERVAGGELKESGTAHWKAPNKRATNKFGFTALPGGYRQNYQAFAHIGEDGYWWTATEQSAHYGFLYTMSYDNGDLSGNRDFKALGYSVRCIRDSLNFE